MIPIERFEVFAGGLDHPECLAFDRDGNLWAGGEAGQVYRIVRAGKVEQVTTLGTFNAGLAFSPEDELIVCNPASGLVRVDRTGAHRSFATHAGDHKVVCANFGVFDRAGNYYVTDSGQFRKRNGFLCRFTPDGNGAVIAGPFGYTNGLALSADERTLYMVESDLDCVWKLSLNEKGDVTHQQIYAENVGRFPDGLVLDANGTLYASCYASDDIHRISAGKVERFAHDRWAILLSRPTNMAFGVGDGDREMMYVANLGRQTITRGKVDVQGQPLANQKRV